MFFTLLNFNILLSLYPLEFFMEFCQFVAVGYSGFKFFIFFLFAEFHVSSSSFVVKSMAKKNHEIFVIRFSFSLFFVCKFYWIFGFLGFFYLVLILGLFQLIYSVFLIFILLWFGFSFSLFLVMQFLLDFWFPGILLFDFNSRFVLV